MSRPFFLPIQSQPYFLVLPISILFSISGHDLTALPFVEIYVATLKACRDIIFCCLLYFCVATLICCHDIISVVSISFFVIALLFILRLKNCLSFHCLVGTWDLGRDLIVSSPY